MNITPPELKAYLTSAPVASIEFHDPDAEAPKTRTIGEWVTAQNGNLINALNDISIGQQLGIIVNAGPILVDNVRLAIAQGDEFINGSLPSSVKQELTEWYLTPSGSLLDTSNTTLTNAIITKLGGEVGNQIAPDCVARFKAVMTKPGTISQLYGGISLDDLVAAFNA